MTPEHMADLVARWVRFYTRDRPTAIAQRRINEINADLYDHITHERTQGTSDRRIAFSILSRMARGLTADASWRRRVRPLEGDPMKPLLAILATVVLAAIGVFGIVFGGYDDAPGAQLLGVLFVVGAIWLGVRTARRNKHLHSK
jgi:peptidoglycan/LPS O-acetylase OafA/YrhL